MECKFKIKGLDCANCAAKLERAINKIKGVEKATISFMNEKMSIELDEDNKKDIMKDVEKMIKKEEPDVTIKEI